MLILEVQQGAEVDGTSSTPTGWARMLGYWVVKYEEFVSLIVDVFIVSFRNQRYLLIAAICQQTVCHGIHDMLGDGNETYCEKLNHVFGIIKVDGFASWFLWLRCSTSLKMTIFYEEREAFPLWRPRLTLGLYTLYTLPPLCYMSHWWSHWSSWWSPWDDPVKEGKTVHNRV